MSVEVEGPEGVPLREKWEIPESSDQNLDDWRPIVQFGSSKVTILSPSGVKAVSSDVPSFELAVDVEEPASDSVIYFEWARIKAPKDPSIEMAGSWQHNTPAGAPRLLTWGQLPASISTGQFPNGLYVVRAKLKGDPTNMWTEWKYFAVGEIGEDLRQLMPFEPGQLPVQKPMREIRN